jgi:TRAP-type C4-dicarboxylate transport system permease small subunit
MSSATVIENSTRLSAIDRLFFRFESLLNLAGGIAIFLLVLLATTNVLGRWLFSLPINGYIDWVEQAMAFIAFLGIAYTKRLGGHIRMDTTPSASADTSAWTSSSGTCTDACSGSPSWSRPA